MKKELRKQIINKRNNISNRLEKDKMLVNNLKELIKNYKNIMIYYPIKNEPNILNLITNDKLFYLPYCLNKSDMEARLITNLDDLVKDKQNVLSSKNKTNNIIDVVIAPSLAMNKSGYRLGFGLGYYDKYLKEKNCIKIGTCYDEFLINDSFQDEWDVKFDYVVTDKRIIEVK